MALTSDQKKKVHQLLSKKIDQKLKTYGRETTSMPFLARLIQDSEKIAAYSFIHSLATSLGMSIYEDVSVIIASLLISTGFGSLLSGRMQLTNLKNILFIIPVLLLSYLLLLPLAFNFFLGSDLFTRGVVSALLLFPLGFVMGMPFPLGIRISEKTDKRLVPWGWCSNLSASVLSSILAASIALYYGFTSVVLLASLAYFLCLLLIVREFSALPLSLGRT